MDPFDVDRQSPPLDELGAALMFGGPVPTADPDAVEQVRHELGAGLRRVRFEEPAYPPVHGLAEEIGLE